MENSVQDDDVQDDDVQDDDVQDAKKYCCQDLTQWCPCPACGRMYDCTKIRPPRVPLTIRCACCCQD